MPESKAPVRYRVTVPRAATKIVGYPEPPNYFLYKKDGESVSFPHGLIVHESKNVPVGNVDRNPPLVNHKIARKHPNIFMEV